MNVEELVKELQNFPPHLRVVVDGYEGGVDDIFSDNIERIFIKLNANVEDYEGAHEQVGLEKSDCEAILIGR